MRIMFLKDILNEVEGSMIFKFLQLQFEQPTRGDWASTCVENLKQLEISETLDEIKRMTRNKFRNIFNERIRTVALKYLVERQGQKDVK